MSNQNSCDYDDVINDHKKFQGANSEGSSDYNRQQGMQDKIDDPSSGFQIAMNNILALISSFDKKLKDDESYVSNNSSDQNHNNEEQQILKEQPVSSLLPHEKSNVKDQPISDYPPQEQRNVSILTTTPDVAPPQNKTHPEPIPQTYSSIIAKPQDKNPAINPHPSNVVQRDETKEGWGWWSAKVGLSCLGWCGSVALSGIKLGLGWCGSVALGGIKLGLELFKSLPLHTQLIIEMICLGATSIVASATACYMFKDQIKQKINDFWGATKQKGKDLALETRNKTQELVRQEVENLVDPLKPVLKVVNQINEGFNNLKQLDEITFKEAKELIQEGKNDELAKYLTYEKQITCDESYKSEEISHIEEIKEDVDVSGEPELETKTKLEAPQEEKKLEAPEEENSVQNTHRQLLEEAIRCHNVEAVKLLLKCKDSLLESAKEVSLNAIPDVKNIAVPSDQKKPFKGVNIQGDQTLLPQAMVKLFDLRNLECQFELSRSFVGTTHGVTLENIGQVEITFKTTKEGGMQANCLVNKGKNDEYSIGLLSKIAAEETQITNGESESVNVLESQEFKQFLTKSINNYHNSLNIIDYLLKQRADPNHMNQVKGLQYDIPLKEAFYQQNQELFVVLLKNQAKPSKELIKYAFGSKDPHSEEKTFYKLLSEPHCNSAGVQLWESWKLADADQSEYNATQEPGKKPLLQLNTQQQVKALPSNMESAKKSLSEEEIYKEVVLYNFSQLEDATKQSLGNRSLPQPLGANEKQEETETPNLNISDNPPAMQFLLDRGNNAKGEESEQEKYDPLDDRDAPGFPAAPPPELQSQNKYISPPSTAASANQFTPDDSGNYNSNSSLQKLNNVTTKKMYRSKLLSTKLPSTTNYPPLTNSSAPTPNPTPGQVVIYDNKQKGEYAQTIGKDNIRYHTLSNNTPGMTPLKLNTSEYPGPTDNNKEIATNSKTSVTQIKSAEHPNTVRVSKDAQPLVLSNPQKTPAKPQNIENSPLTPSSQDLPVVIASPKNHTSTNIILSKSYLDKLYCNLSSKEQIMWENNCITNIIIEFLKLNNISEESVGHLDIAAKNLRNIMNNPDMLEKFMNDMWQQAAKSNSNHPDPFLTIMYGEEKSRELSSNSKIVNISTESYVKLLEQIFLYISVTDPLRHAHITRSVAETTDEDGNKVITIRSTEQMKQEEQQEIQRNNNETSLFDQFKNNKSNLLELYLIIQNIRQNGFRQDHLKAIVGGEKVSEIIWNAPQTTWGHFCKFNQIIVNNARNPENITIILEGAKFLITSGAQSFKEQIEWLPLQGWTAFNNAAAKRQKMLQGGDADKKPDEPSAAKPQPNLTGLFFVNGKWVPGANPLGNFSGDNKVSFIPKGEETTGERLEKKVAVPNPIDAETSDDGQEKEAIGSSNDTLPETDSEKLGANLKKKAQAVVSWIWGSGNATHEQNTLNNAGEGRTPASTYSVGVDQHTDDDNITDSSEESSTPSEYEREGDDYSSSSDRSGTDSSEPSGEEKAGNSFDNSAENSDLSIGGDSGYAGYKEGAALGDTVSGW